MKKIFVISLALMGFAIDAWCCVGEYIESHNNFLFSVFRREMMYGNTYDNEFDLFWKNYTNGEAEEYDRDDAKIMEIAKGRGDTEMVEYLTQLNRYIEICEEIKESWTYPTRAALSQRKIDLNNMVKKASAYKGKRLKDQWALLQMRANMVLGNNEANINYWEKKASKLPQTAYRTLMKDIYAGALLRTGRQAEACNIYADLGDMTSIQWALRKYRNLAGIQRIYDQDPNAACMSYLIQDFVNNAQETLDQGDSEYRKEWLDEIGRKEILQEEVNKFIVYAKDVIASGKVKNPALWQAAIGELHYLYGDYVEAYAALDKAVSMAGTDRMHDNARAIRLVASVKSHNLDDQYTKWLVGEINWLIEKMKEENFTNPEYDKDAYWSYYTYNHYYDVLDRLVFKELAPKYNANGRQDMACALITMMDNEFKLYGTEKPKNDLAFAWTSNYSPWKEGFCTLDEMSGDETVRYAKFISSKGGDDMEQLVKRYSGYDTDYFNDLIGTKYLAENQFEKATEYFKKVPLKFMESQNISFYLANRDYTKEKWLFNQRTSPFSELQTDGPNLAKLTSNPKLNFCNEMMELQRQHDAASGGKRQQLAYKLATRYYQASYLGDCWYLTQYGSSLNDTARVDRPNFVEIAINYLEESKLSTDFKLQEASYYALAFIPIDEWQMVDWSTEVDDYVYIPIPTSKRFKALSNLDKFATKNKGKMSSFVTKCDVLKQFRKGV